MTSAVPATKRTISKLPIAAAIVALLGITDAVYPDDTSLLTAEASHAAGNSVPRPSLTSKYADIAGIPLAAFGALAHIAAFFLPF